MTLWRISNYADLLGIGGLRTAARWHNRGIPIVYLSESPALAMLEVLVNFEINVDEIPDNYQLLEIEYAQRKGVSRLKTSVLPEDWRDDIELTRSIGDEWLTVAASALLRVPSALVPDSYNYLLNPRHPEAKAAKIIAATHHPYDVRLLSAAD